MNVTNITFGFVISRKVLSLSLSSKSFKRWVCKKSFHLLDPWPFVAFLNPIFLKSERTHNKCREKKILIFDKSLQVVITNCKIEESRMLHKRKTLQRRTFVRVGAQRAGKGRGGKLAASKEGRKLAKGLLRKRCRLLGSWNGVRLSCWELSCCKLRLV